MQALTTNKLYYGFPIFILGYADQQFGANLTTCSSSYSLGNMLVFGLASDTNAAQQITHYRQCSLNVLGAADMLLVEQAGFHHRQAKLSTAIAYHFAANTKIPLLEQAQINLLVKIDTITVVGDYTNFTGHIQQRWANDHLIQAGKFQPARLQPVLYVGDDHRRLYRFVTETTTANGAYLKQARQKNKKRTPD
ncbi:flavin reductase [Loigolactobacillus binensis]|uniref:Flavin reductase n=1 Tax=Loigolactobacillus binensis TaxID=2559922 RepID=A0ABW3EDD6_9LACO|nr:flavin reductase [Loigolactobacillus binensis]